MSHHQAGSLVFTFAAGVIIGLIVNSVITTRAIHETQESVKEALNTARWVYNSKLSDIDRTIRLISIRYLLKKALQREKVLSISPRPKKLMAKGIPVKAGSVVEFVIEKGSGSISEKAQPFEFADLKQIDTDYYIHHQILPASLRILKVLGVDEKRLQ